MKVDGSVFSSFHIPLLPPGWGFISLTMKKKTTTARVFIELWIVMHLNTFLFLYNNNNNIVVYPSVTEQQHQVTVHCSQSCSFNAAAVKRKEKGQIRMQKYALKFVQLIEKGDYWKRRQMSLLLSSCVWHLQEQRRLLKINETQPWCVTTVRHLPGDSHHTAPSQGCHLQMHKHGGVMSGTASDQKHTWIFLINHLDLLQAHRWSAFNLSILNQGCPDTQ